MSCMNEFNDNISPVCPHCGYVKGTKAAEPHHMEPESILHKKYIVGKVLGFGGFGVTYIGWDAMLNTKVAIKEYLPSEFATRIPGHTEVSVYDGQSRGFFSSGLESFIQEAQRLARFSSEDGIVKIYDTFQENNTAYIVMEYLEGETVASMLKRSGPMSYEAAMRIVVPVLNTLDKVHQAGIIHRDISPDNLFVTKDNKIKVLDFGSARYATAYNSKSLSVIVKRGYAPPEQYVKNSPQGPWSDNYAVAATFYKMLTGITPVESIDRGDHALVPPSAKGVRIAPPCQNAIMNALNLNPQNRPQTARAFLNGLVSGQAVVKEKVNKDPAKFPTWLKIASAAVASFVLIIAALFLTGTVRFANGRLVFPNAPVAEGYVRVPDILNMNKSEAEDLLEEKDLQMLVTGKKEFEEEVEKDLICEQTPEGGVKTEKDDVVEVKISGGPKIGYVPQAVYYTEETAVKNMEDEGFKVKVKEEYNDNVGKGGVISQNYKENTELKQTEKVEIVVSKGSKNKQTGKVTIPDLTGKDFEEARKELLKKGVYLLIEESKYSNDAPKDSIISQKTAANKSVNKGDNVYVTVSRGKEQVRVVDVQYFNSDEAEKKLEKLGLVVNIEYSEDETVADDLVLSQSIEAGRRVDKGTEIILTVNKLPANGEETTETTTETTTESTTESTTEAEGKVSGTVRDSETNSNLSGVTIKVVKASNTSKVVETITTNSSGVYSVTLPVGDYVLKMSKTDYNDLNLSVKVVGGETTYPSIAKMVKKEETTTVQTCNVSGVISNALDGSPVSGVTIRVRSGLNKTSGSYLSYQTSTNSSGKYSLQLPEGQYTLEITKSNFIKTHVNITAYEGSIDDANMAISPVVEADKIRIVLTWSEQPTDLDAHLLYKDNGTDRHVYFERKYSTFNGQTAAELDVDDRNGYGPETITIHQPNATTYTYVVHNYSGESALSTSNAVVKVYSGNRVIATYTAPTSGAGDEWYVFTIKGEQISTINSLS